MENDEFGSPLLHPLLAGRWSPASFDPSHDVAPDEVLVLLEAARWAPSAGNSQPWAFIVGQRGDATHERLVRHLAGSSARWAPAASVLMANLAHRYVEDTDWEYSEFSLYDLGQAVAHLTLQAQALGLSARQFRAFSRAGVAAEFAVPGHWEVATMMAIGRAALTNAHRPAPTQAGMPARQRRTVSDILWPISWRAAGTCHEDPSHQPTPAGAVRRDGVPVRYGAAGGGCTAAGGERRVQVDLARHESDVHQPSVGWFADCRTSVDGLLDVAHERQRGVTSASW